MTPPDPTVFRDATLALFSTPAGRAWLAMAQAREHARPSYQPGDEFDHVAFREGRKAMLAEIGRLSDPNRTPKE